MDNSGFEMDEDLPQKSSAKTERIKQVHPMETKSHWSKLNFFLLCLLTCMITIVVGVIVLSLFWVNGTGYKAKPRYEANIERSEVFPQEISRMSLPQAQVDTKFQFLHHLTASKKFEFPGGTIQWSRFRKNANQYDNEEDMQFGQSINNQRSKITFGTLLLKSKGLRVPHWHSNANEQGYVLKGTSWIGVVDAGGNTVTTYNVTAGQLVFFPRNTLHWLKNVGAEDCLFLLFFTTHEELQTVDVDDAFFSTPEDIAARSLKPKGGVDFIRTFQKQAEDQAINLPPNLAELVHNPKYEQSKDALVWRYFFNLKESTEFHFPGGIMQWARYVKDGKGLKPNERIYSEFLHVKEDALTLGTLRIYSTGLRQPHFHFNANEMGYVISGCGKVGVIVSATLTTDFTISVGDVVFFPVGTQHYIKSTCDEDLLFILAFSTGNQLETLDMDDYFHATADHILAQLFFKKQEEFKKIPKFKVDQAINLP